MRAFQPKTDCKNVCNILENRSLGYGARENPLLGRQRLDRARSLFRKDLKGHFGCVNAIEFSHHGGQGIVSGGDDRRVLYWNTEEAISGVCKPMSMKGEHNSNIFCLAFDNKNKKVFSGGNDEQVIVHDLQGGETLDVFLHNDAVYGLSADPLNDSIFASACDDGKVQIFDIRAPAAEGPFILARHMSPMHAVMYNPVEPRLLATANGKEGVDLWDIRVPKKYLLRYGGGSFQQSCMSVRINNSGDHLVALRRRLPPVLYRLDSPQPLHQFDHAGYYNSCTMKSCCFAGDRDQYVVSGSDDFNLYVWKIPEAGATEAWVGEAHLVLKGHRSIVNQVRFNPDNHLLLSSGVEKVIKLWSPFQLPESQGDLGDHSSEHSERPVYTHEEYLNLVLRSGQVMTHDYSHKSMDEDPRMMAFFDSLVQRELEGWSSDDSSPADSDILHRVLRAVSPSDDSDDNRQQTDSETDQSPFLLAINSLMSSDASTQGENSTGSPEGVPLIGPRPELERRSISSLIAQRRKEYIANIRRSERQKRFERESRLLRSHTGSSTSRTSILTQLSGTLSSDSETETNRNKAVKRSLKSSTSSLSDNENLVETIESQRNKAGFKRLKALHAKVVMSDCDSSDEGLGSSTRTTQSPISVTSNTSVSGSSIPLLLETAAHLSQSCDLNNTVLDLSQKASRTDTSHNCDIKLTDGSSVNNNQKPSTSTGTCCSSSELKPVEEKTCDPQHNGNVQYNTNSTAVVNLHIDSCKQFVGSGQSQCRNCEDLITSNSSSGANDSSRHLPGRTEFKRSRHRTDKAKRHYRRVNKDDVSSDED